MRRKNTKRLSHLGRRPEGQTVEAPPELKWGTRGAWCPRMPQSRPTSGASKTSLWSPDASHYHTSVPAGGSQTIVLLSENPISQENKRDPQNKKSKMRLGRLRKEANDPGKKKMPTMMTGHQRGQKGTGRAPRSQSWNDSRSKRKK